MIESWFRHHDPFEYEYEYRCTEYEYEWTRLAAQTLKGLDPLNTRANYRNSGELTGTAQIHYYLCVARPAGQPVSACLG